MTALDHKYVDTKLSNIESVDDKIGILDVRVIAEKGIFYDCSNKCIC